MQIDRLHQIALRFGILANHHIGPRQRSQVLRILRGAGFQRRRELGRGHQRRSSLRRLDLRHEQPAPPGRRFWLLVHQQAIQRDRLFRLLHLHVSAGFSGQRVHAAGPQRQRGLIVLHRLIQPIGIERVRALLHRVPEASSSQRLGHQRVAQPILFRLLEERRGLGKIVLLHAHKAEPSQHPRIGGLRRIQILEHLLRRGQTIGGQFPESGLFRRRARNARSGLRLALLGFLQFPRQLRIRMQLQIFAHCRSRRRILHIPSQRLAQRGLRYRVLRILAEDLLALRPRFRSVGQHAPQVNRILRIAGVLRHQFAQAIDGIVAGRDDRGLGVVVGQRPVVRRMRAEALAVNLQRFFVVPVLRQLRGLLQKLILRLAADQAFDLRDLRAVGIHRAQALDVGLRLCVVPAQLGPARQPRQRLLIVGIGKKDLLPGLRRQIQMPRLFLRLRLFEQRRFRRRLRPRRRPAEAKNRPQA